jgi:hypothetical protein
VVHAAAREAREVEGVGEVARPVDAHVVALPPGTIVVVLLDDVGLDAVGRVVAALDVEVLRDREHRDDVLVTGIRRIGAGDLLIAAVRDQLGLGDLPTNALGAALFAGDVERIRRLFVDDGGAEVPLALEDLLVHDVRTDVADVDRLAAGSACEKRGDDEELVQVFHGHSPQ